VVEGRPHSYGFWRGRFNVFLVWYFKNVPYGWNVDVVVTVVMDKDRQESSKKKSKASL
jgi:hypothetical protein